MEQPVDINHQCYLDPVSRSEKKCVQVLQETVAQLQEHQIFDINVESITKACGISKRTIYKYFGEKEKMIAEAIHLDWLLWELWFFDSLRHQASSRKNRLRLFCKLLDEWSDSPDFKGCLFARALFYDPRPDSMIYGAAVECAHLYVEHVRELLSDAGKSTRHGLAQLFITGSLVKLTALPASDVSVVPENLTALINHLPGAKPGSGKG
jgi:AcrR family transcriptional regulator